jgi:hypothetical protein
MSNGGDYTQSQMHEEYVKPVYEDRIATALESIAAGFARFMELMEGDFKNNP